MWRLAVLLFSFMVSSATYSNIVVDDLRVDGQSVPVRLHVYPQEQPAGTVILSHGATCLPEPEKYQWTSRIISWGYNAVLIDHCVKRGATPHMAQLLPDNLQVEDRIRDYLAVIQWVKQQKFSNGRVAIVGHDRGGEGVLGFLNEAHYGPLLGLKSGYSKSLVAAVAYYPGCHMGSAGLKIPAVPTLVNHGELDMLTPASHCIHYTAGKGGKVENLDVETYPGAHHGFDIDTPDEWAKSPRGRVVIFSYNDKQAKKSFDITKSFLDRYLK